MDGADFSVPLAVRYNAKFDTNGNYLKTVIKVVNLLTDESFEYPENKDNR